MKNLILTYKFIIINIYIYIFFFKNNFFKKIYIFFCRKVIVSLFILYNISIYNIYNIFLEYIFDCFFIFKVFINSFFIFFYTFFIFVIVNFFKIFIYLNFYAISLIVPLLICVAYLTLVERKVIGASQRRLGPEFVGLFGLGQPIADV